MKEKNNKFKYSLFFFILFYIVCCFLSFNRHSKSEVFNYHSEIWADRASYYVYLPSLFIYNFSAKEFPPQIAQKTGNGFVIDSSNNKIITKCTYGVALMQAPFFIITHLLANRLGYSNNGFSWIYNKMLDIAGVFYADLAFIFLYFFLIRYVPGKVAFISLACLFLGTNLFYYSIFEIGMSHIYSFFLFSVFLFLSGLMFKPGQPKYFNILFGLVIGLITMVRPINVIFLPVFFMVNKPGFMVETACMPSLRVKPILIIILSACIVTIPQLIYWKYLSGHFFMYAYNKEGFTNLLSPKMLNLWFSTNNGLVIYSPLVLIVLSGLIFMRKVYPQWSLFLAVYFVFISYVFSSWWSWSYGCGFGSRPFVEYYALFSLPLCFLLQYMMNNKLRIFLFGILLVLCIAWNLKLIFSFDGCWYGGDWDWKGLYNFLISPTK